MQAIAVAVFLLSAAFVLYVLFGYPLLLLLLTWRRRQPVRKQPVRKTVSVLLPVRNGERWIRAKLESILALDYPRELVEVLVISNGSTDRTEAIAGEFVGQGARLLRLPGIWAPLAVGAQVLFYGVAAVDRWVPDKNPLKRLSSPMYTFVVLMAAAACAVSILFVPGERLWKPTRVSPDQEPRR